MRIEPKHEHLMNNSGVYQIRNVLTNEVYVGVSKRFKNRYRNHFRQLKSGKHHNNDLLKSFGLYGEENFVFEIVKICESRYVQKKYETMLYTYYKNFGLCLNSIAPTLVSDDLFTKGTLKICIKTGKIVEIFDSITDAANSIDWFSGSISYCCRGNGITVKGFNYQYNIGDNSVGDIYYTENELYKLLYKSHQYGESPNGKPVAQYNKNKKLLNVFPTTLEASKLVGIDEMPIHHAARGYRKRGNVTNIISSSCGFVWEYISVDEYLDLKEDYEHYPPIYSNPTKRIKMIDRQTNEIICYFDSIRDAQRKLKINNLHNIINGRVSLPKKWLYRFEKEE